MTAAPPESRGDFNGADAWSNPGWREAAHEYHSTARLGPAKPDGAAAPIHESRQLISRRASEIMPRDIDFLWVGRLACGKHTCIAGEPGTGKSQLSIAIAAAISTGGEWPCDEGRAPLGNVVMLNAEDFADDTIVPRLIAAGADLARIHIVNAVATTAGANKTVFNLQTDLCLLESKLDEIGNVALIIIDPVSSYMGKTDSHKNSEVRGVLEPISEMAARKRTAVLSVTHFSKSNSTGTPKALHRFIGSIAFIGAPRAAFAVLDDPENDGRLLFLHAKNNMAAPPQGLAFRLVQTLIDGLRSPVSYVAWDSAPVSMTANQALSAEGTSDEKRSALATAEEFLTTRLARGPAAVTEVEEHARALGISKSTLNRARAKLGVRAEKAGLEEGWLLSLPAQGCQNGRRLSTFEPESLREIERLRDDQAEDSLNGFK
jgi:putative DNA primase/helicase